MDTQNLYKLIAGLKELRAEIHENELSGQFRCVDLGAAIAVVTSYGHYQDQQRKNLVNTFKEFWTRQTGQDISTLDPTKFRQVERLLASL